RRSTFSSGAGSIHYRGGDHFQDAAKPVVAAHAALVERSPRNRLPVVAGAVVVEWLRDAGEGGIVLRVVAAELVDHHIQRGDDEDSKASGSRLVEGVARPAGNVTIRI